MNEDCKTARIRALNDELRSTFTGGTVVITAGVQALGAAIVAQVLQTVRSFSNFNYDNDPYGTHEFGNFRIADHSIFFKIDAYDLAMRFQSPDLADPAVTRRVLSVLLAEEW